MLIRTECLFLSSSCLKTLYLSIIRPTLITRLLTVNDSWSKAKIGYIELALLKFYKK